MKSPREYLGVLSLVLIPGCVTSGNVEPLETRLRRQEDRANQLQSNLDEARSQLSAARSEANALRSQLTERGQKTILPEQAAVLFRATGIKFSGLMTGGLDRDGAPGDELLNVVLAPHDSEGDVVKLPGRIQLDVFDLSRPDNDRLIGRWEFTVDESRQHWNRTWFGSGYHFNLPWQQLPESNELLLHARLTTTDGRVFNASTTIHIHPTVATSQPLLGESSHTNSTSRDQSVQQAAFRRIPDVEESELTEDPFLLRKPQTQPESPAIRTSDSWTDATIPRYR